MTARSSVASRIFVVGCPRSGTTLLQGMLAQHSRIASFPETHFFAIAYPRNRFKRALTWPASHLGTVLDELLEQLGRPDLKGQYRVGRFQRHYERPFIALLDRLAEEGGKDLWVEKTPRHLHFIRQITRRVPDVRFIHIVRSGPDVVASLYEAVNEFPESWGGTRTLDRCIERWNRDIQITARWSEEPHHLVVRYEDVVRSTAETARRICDFLGIEVDDAMTSPHDAFDRIVRPDEAWKARNDRPVHVTGEKFSEIFTPQEQDRVLAGLLDADRLLSGPGSSSLAPGS